MKLNHFYLLSFLFLFSCGSNDTVLEITDEDLNSEDNQKEEIIVQTNWSDLEKDVIETDQVFEVVGYVGDIGTMVNMYESTMTVPFVERRNQTAGFGLHMSMNIGDSPNHVHRLPDEFSPEDFKLTCDDGTVVSKGEKVKIKARKSETYSKGYISATLISVEAIEDNFDANIFTNAVKLTSDMVNDTTVKSVYAFIEGKPELPSIIFSYTFDVMLDLKNSSVKEIPNINIFVGDGASSMNDIPDNYTTKDLIIRDFNGEQVKNGSKLRFYGVWERYDFETTTPGRFYVEEIEQIK